MSGAQSWTRRVARGGSRIVLTKSDMIRHLHETSWPLFDEVFRTSGYSRAKEGASSQQRHLQLMENYCARTEALATHEYVLERFNVAPQSQILNRMIGSLHHARMHYYQLKLPNTRRVNEGSLRNAFQRVIEYANSRFDYRVSWYLLDLMENHDKLTKKIPYTLRTLLLSRPTPPYAAHREPENCLHLKPHVVASVDKLRVLREASEPEPLPPSYTSTFPSSHVPESDEEEKRIEQVAPDPKALHMADMFQDLGEPLGVQFPITATFDEHCMTTEYPSYLTQLTLRALEDQSKSVPATHVHPLSLALLRSCSMDSLVLVLNALLKNYGNTPQLTKSMGSGLYNNALGRMSDKDSRWSHLFPSLIATGARHNLLSFHSMKTALIGMIERVRSCDQSASERMEMTEALYEIENRTLDAMDAHDSNSVDKSELVQVATLIVTMHARFRITESRDRVEVLLDRLLENESESLFIRHAGKQQWEMLITSLGPALAMDSLSWMERIGAAHFNSTQAGAEVRPTSMPREFVIRQISSAFLRLGRALSHFAFNEFEKSTTPMYSGLAEALGDHRSTPIEQLRESLEFARDDVAESWLAHLERMSQTAGFSAADTYVKTCKVYLAAERPTLVDQLAVNGQGRAAQLIYDREGESFKSQDETAAQAVGDKAMHMDDMDELGDGRVKSGVERRKMMKEGEEIHPVLLSFNERLKAPSEDPHEAIRLVGELQSKCAPNQDTVTLLVKSFFRESESSRIGTLNVEAGKMSRRDVVHTSVPDSERVLQLRDLCAVLISVCRIYDVCPDADTLTLLGNDMRRLRMEERTYVMELAEYFGVDLETDEQGWTPPSRMRQSASRERQPEKVVVVAASEQADYSKDYTFLKEDGTPINFSRQK